MDVDIVGDIYVRMAQESGKDFDVHAVVIAVRGEGVPKDMFAAKLHSGLPACADGLIAQGFVGKAFSIVGGEDPFGFLRLMQKDLNCARRQGNRAVAEVTLRAVLHEGLLPVGEIHHRGPNEQTLVGKLDVAPAQCQSFSGTQARFHH